MGATTSQRLGGLVLAEVLDGWAGGASFLYPINSALVSLEEESNASW